LRFASTFLIRQPGTILSHGAVSNADILHAAIRHQHPAAHTGHSRKGRAIVNRIEKCVLLLVLTFPSIPIAVAQRESSIRGRVTDPQQRPIVRASIRAYSRATGATFRSSTDVAGVFEFARVPWGEYVVGIEAQGFANPARLVDVRGVDLELDFSLEVAGIHEQVVVTAAGTPQEVDEVSKAVSVVSHEEMAQRNHFALGDALRNVPGLRIQQIGGPGSFLTVRSRGLRNEDTAVLIDGYRLRDPSATQGDASGLIQDLLITSVDRMEVLRGSGSSLYGTNAVGGVINIVTDAGDSAPYGNLLVEGGSLGHLRGRGWFGGATRNDRIAYSGGVSHLNVRNGIDGDDPARVTNGQGGIEFRWNPQTSVSFRIYGADSFLKLNTSPQTIGNIPASGIVVAESLNPSELRRYELGTDLAQLAPGAATFVPSANDPDSIRRGKFVSAGLALQRQVSDALAWSLRYHTIATRREFEDGPAGVSFQPLRTTLSDFNGQIHTARAQLNFRAGRLHQIDAGYEFENESFNNRAIPENPTEQSAVNVDQRSHSLFAQDQIRLLANRLQFSAAFRSQFFSLRPPRFEPLEQAPYAGISVAAPPRAYTGDGSIAWFFRSTGTKLRAHGGNGYRVPSLFERFGTFFGSFGYSTYGDPRLRPERSISADAGVDQEWLNRRVQASATWFYTRLQETIIFDFSGAIDPGSDPFGRFGGYRNSGGGLARGLEFSAQVAPGRLTDLSVSYTYTNSDLRAPIVADVIRAFVLPDHSVSVVAMQRLGPHFFVNVEAAASSSYLAPVFNPVTFGNRAYQFSGTGRIDVALSYQLPLADSKMLRVFGKIGNLLNRTYFENGFRTPGTTAVIGIQWGRT
jgi:iron complex outermembrane receptor protein